MGGGVIAYPTEGVFGLGCLPDDAAAVSRILSIKARNPAMGMILIATHTDQLHDWVDLPDDAGDLGNSTEKPITWIVPATENAPTLIRGDNSGLAVRITKHPVAAALCNAVDSALVSTSANRSGRPAARNRHLLRREFGSLVDFIVPGDCGKHARASEIRDLLTGDVLRAG